MRKTTRRRKRRLVFIHLLQRKISSPSTSDHIWASNQITPSVSHHNRLYANDNLASLVFVSEPPPLPTSSNGCVL